MNVRVRQLLKLAACLLLFAGLMLVLVPPLRARVFKAIRPSASIQERQRQYGDAARARWSPHYERAGIPYPPKELVLLGIKSKRVLEIHAGTGDGQPTKLVRTLPILGMSGMIGPKLREGDRQVPEGLYRIESLNPNSLYHLSLRVSYPNDEDRAQARLDGRMSLGGDIMIHGSTASVGCLAMGDEAAEDLFILADDAGIERIEVVLSPIDFRSTDDRIPEQTPGWVRQRYLAIAERMSRLRP